MNLKLHHIGILVRNMDKAARHYVSQLGYVLRSNVLHDPVQTAHVQFLKLQDDSSYLELVAPDGPDSKLSNQLKKGGGLNHLCYAVGNIEECCERLIAGGMFSLQNPVDAVAFPGRRIAWLMGRDGIPVELVEDGYDEWEAV